MMLYRFIITLGMVLLLPCLVLAQLQTVTIQPGPSTGQDALLKEENPVINYSSSSDFMALAMLNGSSLYRTRALIRFDLSSIPSTAFVKSARLSLYQNTTSLSANGVHEMYNGHNDAYLAKISQPWDETTVTWSNQPAYNKHRNVYIHKSNYPDEDYPDIDITAFVRAWVNDPATNYGMVFRLIDETHEKALIFASSEHQNPARRPRLIVDYYDQYPKIDTVRRRLDVEDGMDAHLGYLNPSTNLGSHHDLMGLAWTCSGIPCGGRGIMQFNNIYIPDSSVVVSAHLNLFQNTSSANAGGGHAPLSGLNDAFIARVTEPWGEYTVTWNNAPDFTTASQKYLPPSEYSSQDYLGIDITDFLNLWRQYPDTNYGMILRLYDENYYRALIFSSSDHPNSAKWPELVIAYKDSATTMDTTNYIRRISPNNPVKLFPNPARTYVTVEVPVGGEPLAHISITDTRGRVVLNLPQKSFTGRKTINLQNLKPGIYFLRLVYPSGSRTTEKLVVY